MSLQKVPSFFLDCSEPDMKGENGHSYGFGRFTLNVAEQRLSDGESHVPLTPKAFDVLSLLVQNAGHLVEKEDLMTQIWPDSFVEESNVAKIVYTLRKRLGDGNGSSFIETVPTKGYRFVADVEVIEEPVDDGTNAIVSSESAAIDARTVEPADGPVTKTSDPAEASYRRLYFAAAAIVVLGVMVTGFWISNGSYLPHPRAARFSKHSPNSQAYRLFQEGRQLLRRRDGEGGGDALENFEKAVELDPSYAEAYVGIAAVKSYHPGVITNDDLTTAREAVKKALALDPDNVYGHTINCRIMGTNDWEFEEAVTECRHAVELDPNDADAHRELGFALNVVGRQSEALAEMETAVAISPTAFNKQAVGMILTMSGQYDEAISELQQVDETDPTLAVNRWLMRCYMLKNDQAKAFEYFIRAQEQFNGTSSEDLNAIRAAFAGGGWPAAVPVALDTPALRGKHNIISAILYAQIGEKDKAFEVLSALHRDRSIILVTVPRDPIFEPLHDDPRYAALLSDMNLK